MSETEQNKTEEPTQFKLKKAREKGNVAKGQDLAFFGTLMALALYVVVWGPGVMERLSNMMRISFVQAIKNADTPQQATLAIGMTYQPAIQAVALLGGLVFVCVAFLQVLQVRGIIFTTHPLKPDFSKINPAKGLKKLFSMRTLKEALKNIFKMTVYLACTYFLIKFCINLYGPTLSSADKLVSAFYGGGLRLLFMYMALALVFTAIDQVIVRKEFLKQMRMSKSEVTREHKDREGEPRLKQKRKQLHAEYVKQTSGLGNLAGSDVLIVNPQHYAVGLVYNPKDTKAPIVTTKGRNRFALLLKEKAFNLGIPIIEHKPLARSLFKTSEAGDEISENDYQKVADIYLKLYRDRNNKKSRIEL